jgi:ATP-dependent DNA helicase UvrD/PcrA
MTMQYLEKLNPQQSRAVQHGGPVLAEANPLLIIAGAGSGKTNTLAHRVAHLIVNDVDPRRIMLLTFSRRAAANTRVLLRMQSPGPERSTLLVRASCASTPNPLASIVRSPFTIELIPPI